MPNDEFLDLNSVPEIYVDGFAKHLAREGVMTCVGYRNLPEGKVVVLRLVWPAVNTVAAMESATTALNVAERPAQGGGRGGSKPGVH